MTDGAMTAAATAGELWDAAERLRVVRRAHERFLGLWALDRLLDAPRARDDLKADLDAQGGAGTPDNRDGWDGCRTSLFRGGRLDD